MEKRLNPEFMPFRFKLSPKMAKFNPKFEKQSVTKKEVRELIDNDVESFFSKKYKNLEELYNKCKFITFEGNVKEYVKRLNQKDKINFMFLAYLGKSQNHLRSNIRNPDISVLALLNRINLFAEKTSEMTGKEAKVTIAIENAYYNKNILLIGNSAVPQTLKKVRALMNDFNIKNIDLVPVEKFLQGNTFQKVFEEDVRRNASMQKNILKMDKYSDLRGITYYLIPTASFSAAVKMYTSPGGKKLVAKKASESMIRYLAFMSARDKTDFWGYNKRFVRCTLSFKPGATTFQYSVGRMPPFHGVAIVRKDRISTEYYYDLAYATMAKKLEPTIFYYNKEPFYNDIGLDL